MVKIYKIFEDFEIPFILATETGIISVANNIIDSDETQYFGYEKFKSGETDKAKHFITNVAMLNCKELQPEQYLQELETISIIEDIGNGYIELC